MARFRLSTDILSPLHSDISLNDISAISYGSFGSLSGALDFDKETESPGSHIGKDLDILCAKSMKECVGAFEEISNDFKKQTNINAEKEEKYKESYEMLRKSMDDLQPTLADSKTNNFGKALNVNSKSDTVKVTGNSEHSKVQKKVLPPGPKRNPVNAGKKPERIPRDSCAKNKEKKADLSKNTHSSKGSRENSDTKIDNHVKNELDVIADDDVFLNRQKSKSSKVLSTKAKVKGTTRKTSSEKDEGKEAEILRKFNVQSERKIPVSNNMPSVEQKGISIEKSIQLTIGMEMDNIRRFMLDQNSHMRKDLNKLQKMANKQAEVTTYMFSVIDELLQTNKKLISNCK